MPYERFSAPPLMSIAIKERRESPGGFPSKLAKTNHSGHSSRWDMGPNGKFTPQDSVQSNFQAVNPKYWGGEQSSWNDPNYSESWNGPNHQDNWRGPHNKNWNDTNILNGSNPGDNWNGPNLSDEWSNSNPNESWNGPNNQHISFNGPNHGDCWNGPKNQLAEDWNDPRQNKTWKGPSPNKTWVNPNILDRSKSGDSKNEPANNVSDDKWLVRRGIGQGTKRKLEEIKPQKSSVKCAPEPPIKCTDTFPLPGSAFVSKPKPPVSSKWGAINPKWEGDAEKMNDDWKISSEAEHEG